REFGHSCVITPSAAHRETELRGNLLCTIRKWEIPKVAANVAAPADALHHILRGERPRPSVTPAHRSRRAGSFGGPSLRCVYATVETTAGAAKSRGRQVRRSARSVASSSTGVQPIERGNNR